MMAIWQDLINPTNIFSHLGYIFLIASMAMSQMRWLRLLALCSGVASMVHFQFVTRDVVSLVWEAAFTLANGTQLAVLTYRSRATRFSEEERFMLEEAFSPLERADQRSLLSCIVWEDAEQGDVLMRQDDSSPPLLYVAAGAAAIEHAGTIVGVCGRGDFLGEMSMISSKPASATVRVTNRARIARFDHDMLEQFIENNPAAKQALDGALNQGLAAKVLRMNQSAAARGSALPSH